MVSIGDLQRVMKVLETKSQVEQTLVEQDEILQIIEASMLKMLK